MELKTLTNDFLNEFSYSIEKDDESERFRSHMTFC